MDIFENFADKWKKIDEKGQPVVNKTLAFCERASKNLIYLWKYMVKWKKVFLAVPVGTAAVLLGIGNLTKLPDTVGLNLQSDGTFTMLIARELAVLGPIAITALCLLLMFGSKRTLTPWLVSVFSLAIPLLILITNTFPS